MRKVPLALSAILLVVGFCDISLDAQKPLRRNRMIAALEAGQVALTGETWTWIEQEHEPFDLINLRKAVTAVLSKKNAQGQVALAPFVRIPMEGDENAKWAVKQILEMGAMGIIAPHVNTAQEALNLVKSMRFAPKKTSKYPEPRGGRGCCGVTIDPNGPASLWGLTRPLDYFERDLGDVWPLNPEGELFLMAMIEHPDAVTNLKSILDVPGVGGAIIGPGDLNVAMGNVRTTRGPDTEEAIRTVLTTCKAMKKYCGMVDNTPEGIKKYTDLGARFMYTAGREGAAYSPYRNVK